jgi:hypothetical protein
LSVRRVQHRIGVDADRVDRVGDRDDDLADI